jgi:tyrosyl-tRNA synthetase
LTVYDHWNDWTRRGLIHQATAADSPGWMAAEIAKGPLLVYCGFDPTADSLHLGSLMPLLSLRRFLNAGLKPIALVGGATGMIGDPSGKTAERNLLDAQALERNVAGLTRQIEKLLEGKAGVDFLMVDNSSWFKSIGFIDFLRDVGKHFTVNVMMAKESVRARLEDREHGISYTEFSYMLLQAYDFLHLFQTQGCKMQIGGSDQWGNITAGIDLIKRKHSGADAQGVTFPLLTTAAGQKFGKSERGAVWLDPSRTHPYFMFKYLFDAADADVVKLLGYLTFVPFVEIETIAAETADHPERRNGQRRLAAEVTGLVHGKSKAEACAGLEGAMHADDAEAFETHAGTLGLLSPTDDESLHGLLPVVHRPRSLLGGDGLSVADLAIEMGLFKSRGEIKREIQTGGGFLVAGEKVTDVEQRLTPEAVGNRKAISFRKGKKNKRMLCLFDQ